MSDSSIVPKSAVAPPDLEIKDAQLIFNGVWIDLLEQHGRENLKFPGEFIWLGGAPGAGKGTNTPFIAQARDITAPPIVISALLTTPQAVAIKNTGQLVGDREVIGLLLEELLDSKYQDGVVVDGFPRTKVQVECLKLFYHAMLELHAGGPNGNGRPFRKPLFRIALLFVTEEVSVQRQLARGREIRELNRQVAQSGVGTPLEERVTDLDPALCRKRYKAFKEANFEALQSLRKIFHFHFIDAEGALPEVQQNILREFKYQSSLELSPEVFGLIRNIPVATQLGLHARQELVTRLENYLAESQALFARVVQWIETKIIPIVRAHAMSGHAQVNSEETLLEDPLALRMVIDILWERGFHATVDIHRVEVPERIDPETWIIHCRTKKVYQIEVRYPPSDIRRGH